MALIGAFLPESFFSVWVSNPCFSDVTNYHYCFSCARKERNVKITNGKNEGVFGDERDKCFFFCLGSRALLWVNGP
jgi:hypothetical protein